MALLGACIAEIPTLMDIRRDLPDRLEDPNGSMWLFGIYMGLKVVPMSLLEGLCMYYIGMETGQ